MKSLDEWNQTWFGVWRETGDAYRKCPSIKEFVSPAVSERYDKHCIAHYLSSAKIVAATSRIGFPCVVCGTSFTGSISYRTDGRWLWLDDLSHYVQEHNVAIPTAMLETIQRHDYEPPDVTDNQVDALEWPPIEA